jgi:outer membrane immunogenic protein
MKGFVVKKALAAGTALSLILSAGSALAADLPSRKAPPPVYIPPPLWTGFYLGLNAGYSWDANPNITTGGYGVAGEFDRNFPGFDHVTPDALSASGIANANSSGFIGGVQAGYNYQWGSNFVVGLEADLQGSGVRGRGSFAGLGTASLQGVSDTVLSAVEHEKTVDWLGTLRGRVGYLVTPTLLAYATGGLAYGGVSANTTIAQGWSGNFVGPVFQTTGGLGGFSDVRLGWTVGGGLEWMFAPNWSVKGEYLYYDLGSAQWNSGPAASNLSFLQVAPQTDAIATQSHARFSGHIARLGLNYHFAGWGADTGSFGSVTTADLPNRKGPPGDLAPLWGGFYAGLNAGYSWDANTTVSTAGYGVSSGLDDTFGGIPILGATALSATGASSASGHGYVGGGQVGYNLRLNTFIAGLEADIQGAGVRGRGSFAGLGTALDSFGGVTLTNNVASSVAHEKTVDWLGTVRGRIGYLVTPALLAYATGGLAYGGVTATTHIGQAWAGTDNLSSVLQTLGGVGYFSDTRVGWTVGGGLEWMFMPNWSLKGEYLYYDLGSTSWNSSQVGTFSNLNPGLRSANIIATQSTTRFDGHIARAGVNYHFGWGAPAIASY